MLRPWLNSLLALMLACAPAAAEGFGQGGGFNYSDQNARPQNDTVTLTRGACEHSAANATTYNFTTIDTGSTATDTGLIVIVAMGEDGLATFGVNSVVVNGITMTEVIDEDGTGIVDAALYRGPIEMQGGSLATVDVTFSEAVTSATVCAWLLKNLRSLTPTSSVQDDDTASGALVLTTGTTTAGGFVIGGCISQDTAVTTTWAVLTEVEDTTNTEADVSNADAAATGASMANTCDWSGTGDASGVAAAFR